jgi:hypothetical protein
LSAGDEESVDKDFDSTGDIEDKLRYGTRSDGDAAASCTTRAVAVKNKSSVSDNGIEIKREISGFAAGTEMERNEESKSSGFLREIGGGIDATRVSI